jgi:hypothetical protein
MCTVIYRSPIDRLWVVRVPCTTDADLLYTRALDIIEREGGRLIAVEPCASALLTAIAPPPAEPDPERPQAS